MKLRHLLPILGLLIPSPLRAEAPANAAFQPREAQNGHAAFPGLSSLNLAEAPIELPGHFAAHRAWLVVVSSNRDTFPDIRAWAEVARNLSRAGSDVGFLCIALTPRLPGIARNHIWQQLREGIRTEESRANLLPVFTEVDEFCTELDIAEDDRDTVTTLVLDARGLIHWRSSGPPSDQSRTAARSAISELD